MLNFFLFSACLLLLMKSANLCIRYSTSVAKSMRISAHVVGFLIIALISVLPETLVSITSALQGIPAFGLGTLFGSNVADLTLVFAIVIFLAREIKIQKNILQMNLTLVVALSIPLLFGLNGYYSRLEGVLLILVGILFYVSILKKSRQQITESAYAFSVKNLLFLLLSMAVLLLSAHFTVKYGVALAGDLQIHPVLVGMFLVGLGTTLPELFFSLNAVNRHQDGLALGDVLGTVVTDATMVVGIVALISPFAFPREIVFVTGFFMLSAALFLFSFMRTDRMLTRKEGVWLVIFYLGYMFVEFVVNQ